MSKKNKNRPVKRKLLISLCVVLSVVLVLLITCVAYLEGMLGLINRNIDNSTMSASEYQEYLNNQTGDVDPTAVTIDPNDVTWDPQSPGWDLTEDILNILVIGQDQRAGEGRQRSDSMILCTVNIPEKTLTLTSFMRDMYVQIPGYYDDRINACYQIGGMQLLDNCLEENFGVVVDGNIEVNFKGFLETVDLLGGVNIELTQAEADYLNRRGNWDFNNSTAWQWNLKAGMNRLTGEQAFAYSRIRYIGNGDFERTERQRKVISALIDSCRGKSVSELNSLLRSILPHITTDMSNPEIMNYALIMFSFIKDLKINTLRIPAEGTYRDASIRGMSVLVPDLAANSKLLKETIS